MNLSSNYGENIVRHGVKGKKKFDKKHERGLAIRKTEVKRGEEEKSGWIFVLQLKG